VSPLRLPIELIDVEHEADSITETFSLAQQAADVFAMRECFTRLVRNHRNVVHILTELCAEVAQLKEAAS
jgi:hypothetical protein